MKSPPSKRKAKATSSRARVIKKKYKAFDNISLDEATKLIAPRGYPERRTSRAAENNARKQIVRHVKTGNLRRETDGAFYFGYLVGWAKNEWPGKFDGLPAIIGGSSNSLIESKFCASATVLAPTLEVCQERLNAAQRRIEELEKEIAGLRPYAKQWLEYYDKITRRNR